MSSMNHTNTSSHNIGHSSGSHAHGNTRRTGAPSQNIELSYDTFNNSASSMEMSQTGNSAYSMTNLDLGGQVLENVGGHPNNQSDVLVQPSPNMEVGGQAVRPAMFMTPLQLQMHQQL